MAPRLEHSRKPDLFYETVDRFVGAVPRVELFARRQWPNWRCFGNELTSQEAR
jgi:N6-adenosine-specific RNA methylase IME4